MSAANATVRILVLVLLALAITACGSGDETADTPGTDDSASTSSDAGTSSDEDVEPGSPEAAKERMSGGGGFVSTPELEACMARAGWESDAPVHGSIAAFRHPSGAGAWVAVDAGKAFEVANQVGTEASPANISGTTVTTGPAEHGEAAVECLAG